RFDAKSAALAITDSRNPYSKFSAKGHAPNHQKTTDALAYNACSTRALGMQPKAQCKGRRRACIG
ncbi:hypothetical protein, partial [Marinobacter salarius]|uniref:hypothetical protein n=1 Tax=Marinobacter salarius TaxID=1420917 RepID=UPI001BCEF523